jgi:ABC-type amino acid transport substrate-binding protein
VIEDGEIAGQALQSGDIDAFSTSNGTVIADFRKVADQPDGRSRTRTRSPTST